MSLAPSKRAGERTEAAVLEAVPQLDPIADRDAGADAIVAETFRPTHEIPSVALPIVERGRRVEIKSALVELPRERAGRYYLRHRQHRELVDGGDLYLFAVVEPRSREPLALKIAPATCVDDVVPSWIDPDGRATYAQVAWTKIFDDDELRDRSEGPIERAVERKTPAKWMIDALPFHVDRHYTDRISSIEDDQELAADGGIDQ